MDKKTSHQKPYMEKKPHSALQHHIWKLRNVKWGNTCNIFHTFLNSPHTLSTYAILNADAPFAQEALGSVSIRTVTSDWHSEKQKLMTSESPYGLKLIRKSGCPWASSPAGLVLTVTIWHYGSESHNGRQQWCKCYMSLNLKVSGFSTTAK